MYSDDQLLYGPGNDFPYENTGAAEQPTWLYDIVACWASRSSLVQTRQYRIPTSENTSPFIVEAYQGYSQIGHGQSAIDRVAFISAYTPEHAGMIHAQMVTKLAARDIVFEPCRFGPVFDGWERFLGGLKEVNLRGLYTVDDLRELIAQIDHNK